MGTRRALDLATFSKFGIYTLVAVAVAALWTGGALGVTIGGPIAAAGVGSWFWEKPRVDPDRFGRAWTALTLGFIGLCAYLLVFGDTGFVQVGVYLVLYLTCAKLFQRTRLADNVQLLALSFLLIAAATAFSDDVAFAALFGIYVVVGVVTFSIHHLQVQLAEQKTRGGRPGRGDLFGPRYVVTLVTLALVAFASAVGFFFLFPRLGFGFFVQKSRAGVQQTGFSENVDLGTHGTIRSDNTVVMRIVVERDALDALPGPYWRGISFDKYDGVGWANTLTRKRSVSPNQDWEFKVARLTTEDPSEILSQKIYLEPIGSSVLFGLPSVLQFGLAQKDKNVPTWVKTRRGLTYHEGGTFRLPLIPRTGFQYEVESWPGQYDPKFLRAQSSGDGLPEHQRVAYVQLPSIDPRIRALTEVVTREATTDYDRAIAVERHLKENYTYTTDLPDPGAEPPIEAFLFTNKRGHCEFYATAMVVMLRSIGIRARMANGFLGGTWNEFDDFFAVRNRDAHSWVEVHLAEAWWVRFDPTPPAADSESALSLWDRAYSLYDSLKFKWLKYVIEYDLETQLEILRNASNALAGAEGSDEISTADLRLGFEQFFWSVRRNFVVATAILFLGFLCWLALRIRGRTPIDLRDALVIAAFVAAVATLTHFGWRPHATRAAWFFAMGCVGLAAWLGLARRRRRKSDPKPSYAGISRTYAALRQDLIRGGGVHLDAMDGPETLLARVRLMDLPSKPTITTIVERYMSVRFGDQTVTKAELTQLRRDVREVRRSLRKRKI
jgi:hypothetical protein